LRRERDSTPSKKTKKRSEKESSWWFIRSVLTWRNVLVPVLSLGLFCLEEDDYSGCFECLNTPRGVTTSYTNRPSYFQLNLLVHQFGSWPGDGIDEGRWNKGLDSHVLWA
jgi:hypothetical protein